MMRCVLCDTNNLLVSGNELMPGRLLHVHSLYLYSKIALIYIIDICDCPEP
jgi:hypothetical protein